MFSLRNRVTYVASQLYWQHGTEGLSAARPRRSIRRLLDPKLEHMRTPGRLSGLARRVGCNSIAHRRRLCRLPLFAVMQLCSLSVAVLSLRLCHSFVCGLYSETSSGPSLSSERRPCPAGPRGQPVVQWVSSCNPAKQNTDTQTQQAHTHTHAHRHTHRQRQRHKHKQRYRHRRRDTHRPAPPGAPALQLAHLSQLVTVLRAATGPNGEDVLLEADGEHHSANLLCRHL